MAIIIKEMHVRTVVEKRVMADAALPEEVIRKIESRILDRLFGEERFGQTAGRQRKRNER